MIVKHMNQYYYYKVYIVVLIYISHIALNEISCTIKQRFHADLMREQVDRTERKWQRKLKQYADAA